MTMCLIGYPLNSEEDIGIKDAQLTNLHWLREAVASKWTKISEEYLQHAVKYMS